MSSLGSAVYDYLADNDIDVHPGQIPDKAFESADSVVCAYMILPGDGPIPTNDAASSSDTRTERVRLSLSVRGRSYAAVEAAAGVIVRLMDRVSQATWDTVLIQSALVIGWQDTPLEADTELFQRVVDVAVQYNEVAT